MKELKKSGHVAVLNVRIYVWKEKLVFDDDFFGLVGVVGVIDEQDVGTLF